MLMSHQHHHQGPELVGIIMFEERADVEFRQMLLQSCHILIFQDFPTVETSEMVVLEALKAAPHPVHLPGCWLSSRAGSNGQATTAKAKLVLAAPLLLWKGGPAWRPSKQRSTGTGCLIVTVTGGDLS